jgi:hypothetical protein
MADRTRLNREIAEQHGGQTQTKVPGRETKKETEEPHAVDGEQAAEQVAADPQPAEQQPARRRSVFDAPLQADLDAQQERAGDEADPTDD